MVKYFFDTYALIELIKTNPNYIKYGEEKVFTSKLNLIELFYRMLEDLGEERAIELYIKFKECSVEINDEILFKAMSFRLKNKKRNLSYTDCIGYIYAME